MMVSSFSFSPSIHLLADNLYPLTHVSPNGFHTCHVSPNVLHAVEHILASRMGSSERLHLHKHSDTKHLCVSQEDSPHPVPFLQLLLSLWQPQLFLRLPFSKLLLFLWLHALQHRRVPCAR